MKHDYLRYAVLALLIAAGTASCSDDDTPVKPEPSPVVNPQLPEHPELTLEAKTIDLLINKEATLRILDGAGDYRLSVLDPQNVEATLAEEATIRLKGLQYGHTDLVVSDRGGSYTTITVNVYKSDELQTSVANGSLKLTLAMGEPATGHFTITAGNDPYKVESSDPQTVSATLKADGVSVDLVGLKGQEEGAAPVIVKVTDARGLSAEIPVTTTVSDTPFTDEQLEQIKSISSRTYVMNNADVSTLPIKEHLFARQINEYSGTPAWYWGAYAMTTSTNFAKYCIYFLYTQDPTVDLKVVGKKANMKITFSTPDQRQVLSKIEAVDTKGNPTVEVIKAENGMSWITFYCYSKNKLYIGYMVLPWN